MTPFNTPTIGVSGITYWNEYYIFILAHIVRLSTYTFRDIIQ